MLLALLAFAAACGSSRRKGSAPNTVPSSAAAGEASSADDGASGGGGNSGKAGAGGSGGVASSGVAGDGDSTGITGTGGLASGGQPGAAGRAGAGGSAFASAGTAGTGATTSGAAGSGGSAGTADACPAAPAAGAPAVVPCEVPRSDCDSHASCLNVAGVDGCVCGDGYFGDGTTCDGPRAVSAVGTSDNVTCVVIGSGNLRCFGNGEYGAFGIDNRNNDIGDNEPASTAPLLTFDQPVKDVAVGELTTCALFVSGDVRCWGYGIEGALGTGMFQNDYDWTQAKPVRMGGTAVAVSGTGRHLCAILDTGGLRCWGSNGSGATLGYDDTDPYGRTPADSGDLDLPGRVVDVSASNDATCAVIEDGSLYCWGTFGFTLDGQAVGGQTAGARGPIDVGTSVKQVAATYDHVCVLTTAGNVRCFGENFMGQLGYDIQNEPIGDDESIASAGDVDVGGEVQQVVVGGAYSCALLTTGKVRCWGLCGAYAYGNCEPIGDNETPADAGDALLGGTVARLSAAPSHVCARMTDGNLRCWGKDNHGELGYGVLDDVGDLTPPACAGTVPVF